MLSAFVKKLLFSRQITIDKNIEVLGFKKVMISPEFISNLDGKEVYKTAKEIFKKEVEEFSKKTGIKNAKLIENTLNLMETYGLGKFSLVGKRDGKIIIRVDNSPFYKKSKKATCHYTTGALAGLFSVILRKDVEGKEERCISKGDSFCKFVLRWKK